MFSGRQDARADAARFVVAGAVNTAMTLAVYEGALFFVTPFIAYALSWTLGLLFLVVVYPDRVFRGGRRQALDRLAVAASYALVFLAGLAVLRLLDWLIGMPRLAIVAVLAVTTALNFLLSRAILRRR